jgi:ribosomal protein S27E
VLEEEMRFHADVKCYHCAHVWGAWEWESGRSRYLFRARTTTEEMIFSAPVRIRCPRCGGPTFIDEESIAQVALSLPQVESRRVRQRRLARAS